MFYIAYVHTTFMSLLAIIPALQVQDQIALQVLVIAGGTATRHEMLPEPTNIDRG